MNRLTLGIGIIFIFSASLIATGQRQHFPTPPPPATTQVPTTIPSPKNRHLDAVQLQREARELSDLAKSIPIDIDSVNRGMIPKDTAEKLKRIEKLSKHLRGEIGF